MDACSEGRQVKDSPGFAPGVGLIVQYDVLIPGVPYWVVIKLE